MANSYLILPALATISCVACSEPTASATQSPDLGKLTIGNKAPAISASSWLRGQPVDEFEQGHIYVMEFWASWCVPCVAGMPHLSKLQRTHADDVTIIGMNIWEQPSKATQWMTSTGVNLMEYTVALQQGTDMESLWMEPAGQQGIPAAFIIDRSGLVAWIGHPADLDIPLAKIVEEDWDLDAARIAHQSGVEIERRKTAAIAQFEQIAKNEIEAHMAAKEANDLDAFAATSTALINLRPPHDIATNILGVGIHRMLTGQRALLAAEFIKKNQHVINNDKPSLVMYGKAIIHDDLFTQARDADLSIALLSRACELDEHKDSDLLSLLAQAYLMKATQIQSLSVIQAPDDATKTEQRSRLDAYQKALVINP
ncbi:MAG: TlpA family protein disulfide reductase [Phycisphaerales bacterium]